jgi:hypothetical protein
MKRCPSCGADYGDPNLNFCLNDGSLLENASSSGAPESEETVVMFQPPTSPAAAPRTQFQTPAIAPTPSAKSGGSGIAKILIGLVVVGFLFLVVAGAGAAAFVYYRGLSMIAIDDPPPNPPTAPAKKDPNKQIQEEIAKIQKQIEEQTTSEPKDSAFDLPIEQFDPRPATVNSPNDGFLALRSLPNSDIGTRLAKIPHGETITIGMCIDTGKAGGKKGSWCMARYGSLSGWVFDAYLIYDN